MSVFKGNITGSIKSTAIDIAGRLKSIAVYNKSGGAIVVSIGVVISGTDRYLFSFNLAAAASAGSYSYVSTDITIPASAQLLVVAGGSTDYYLTIDPIIYT